MFGLVADVHLSDIDSFYWEELQRHAPSRILRMSINGASMMIFNFASWVFYVPTGCRDLFIR